MMFGLIVLGSIVRTTGSGLACPDWPLCHGHLLPPMEFNAIVEWLHRFVALLVSLLLLTTTGRRSGESRTSALIFGRDGDDYLIVGSMGGAPKHPSWYHNLTANPDAEIQVRGDHIPVTTRTASDDEKPRFWQIMTEVWPNYDVYQTRTDRSIPVVVLSPK